METAVKNKAKYKKVARVEESEITKHRAQEVVDLLHHVEFPPCKFKIDCIRAPVLDLDIANAVGLKYRRLSIHAKTKFYVD